MTTPTTILQRLGNTVALLTLGAGLALGWGALGSDGFVLLGVLAFACGVWGRLLLHNSEDTGRSLPRARMLAAGVAAPAVLISAIGFGNLAGFAGLVVLALVLLVSPVVHGPLLRRGRRTSDTWTHPSVSTGIVQPLHTMSLEQLCDGWTASYVALASTRDPVLMERLSHLRQAYLDELERRFPTKFEAWLRTHAQPGADPQAHLANDDAA